MKSKVFVSPLAGRWFPADAGALKEMIAGLLPMPRPAPVSGVCAVLVPHAGYQYSGKVACQVYARLDTNAYDRVVVLGLSHSLALSGRVSVPDADTIETPLGQVAVDTAFVAALRKSPLVVYEPRAHLQEHSDQIQVPLLQTFFGDRLKLVTIVVGQMNPASSRNIANVLRPLLDARTLVVASSDFTHYGPNFNYVPFTTNVARQIEALDHQVFAPIAAVDADRFRNVMEQTQATVCGHNPISVLLELLPPKTKVTEVAYDTSGRQLNDWENSVSYLGAIFVGDWRQARAASNVAAVAEVPLDEEDKAQLLKLARATLEAAVRRGKAPAIEDTGVRIRPGMQQVMGGFVTLNLHHELRGCIGEIFPRREIWQVVQEQAVNAALHDPRFEPVSSNETKDIRIEISALTPPKPVASYRDIVIGRHGMTLSKNGRSAVFLPQVAPEQGWDLATTLTYLARKAGLPADAWKQGAEFTVFEAQVFQEKK
ncbi:MAG: AmmeMemoRadiSam system protein B [Kiritimatiellia bacterium]